MSHEVQLLDLLIDLPHDLEAILVKLVVRVSRSIFVVLKVEQAEVHDRQ